jgi:hypothetical protein
MALEIGHGQVTAISAIVNPEKLGHLGLVGDVRALMKRS